MEGYGTDLLSHLCSLSNHQVWAVGMLYPHHKLAISQSAQRGHRVFQKYLGSMMGQIQGSRFRSFRPFRPFRSFRSFRSFRPFRSFRSFRSCPSLSIPWEDCIWMETGKPILAQATQFAQERWHDPWGWRMQGEWRFAMKDPSWNWRFITRESQWHMVFSCNPHHEHHPQLAQQIIFLDPMEHESYHILIIPNSVRP